MSTTPVYIVAARRSPVGRFLGGLARLSAMEVGAQVARAVLDGARVDPAAVDEVIVGQVLQAGCGQNPARQVALAAGLPDTISCCTVNTVCGSGLQAVMYAAQAVRAGDAEIVLAGGIESMSQAPFLTRHLRGGSKFGHVELTDGMLYDGLTNVYDGALMGEIADETAEKAGVSRADQDAWALRSHQRATKAEQVGHFAAERVPMRVPKAKEPLNTDETVRTDASLEALAGLKPAFGASGTVTAGNASALSDGAALVLVASAAAVERHGWQPLARIVSSATAGGPPRALFFAPIAAGRQVCQRAGWAVGDVEWWELNEAFAAQTVACVRGLELDEERVNPHGGAIALGHPIGASGGRVLVTLVHGLAAHGARRGVAALCLGGGNAVAMAVERA